MSRLTETFTRTRNENRAALIGYITAGDPDIEASFAILDAACGAGLDVLEIGIPFSDPTADGPVIQRAAGRALKSGMTLETGIDFVRRLRKKHDLPIILFSYYNPVLAMGTERFVTEAIAAGADGALVVDLPNEMSDELMQHVKPSELFAFIRLVAPTTDPLRRLEILRRAEGFVYVVSRRGVTGVGEIDWNALSNEMKELRKETAVPLCIGFGVSTAEDVQNVSNIADGAIIGSAFQRIIEKQPHTAAGAVADCVKMLRCKRQSKQEM
ncbi:MAG: tryptophan synthase subunit alpha [Planctomycetaceae bacterium]|nr:tryptophan synthase subunit alpha [Planctomycetaceae bacterium]